MEDKQKRAIEDCMLKLSEEIDVGQVALYLRAQGILTTDDFEHIQSQTTSSASRMVLLEIIQRRDKSWNAFIEALNKAKQSYLVSVLKARLQEQELKQDEPSSAQTPTQSVEQKQKQKQDEKKIQNLPQLEEKETILQALEAVIRLTGRRRTLESQQELVVPMLNASEAVEAVKNKGISQNQYRDIKNERDPQRAAQMLYDVLLRMESGYLILTAHMKSSDNLILAEDLEVVCEDEIARIIKQVEDFIANGKTEEIDRVKRNELIRILRRKFRVKEAGGSFVVKDE